jgi:hypothetical protein
MPFDPKLIHPDDAPLSATGDLQLPDDLAALAEQLGDDAKHLAAQYPVDRPVWASRLDRQPRRRWARVAGLVGASLATLLIGLVAVQRFGGSETEPGSGVFGGTGHSIMDNRSPSKTLDPFLAPSLGPAISLTELSGPEQEAVFDLWQRGDDDQPGIAF